MVGIHSTREFTPQTVNEKGRDVPRNDMDFEGRAAPNLGIYNRVCHREHAAKKGYKFSSWLINSCLGLQVVVAAALTAMGAANTNHVSITAFGAINTVIAAILTYLKGSGLPNRIRWYENEWKKIREYIEQRERDFSRPECLLDVGQVVEVIEAMYEEVKADIQTNTPESYISVSDIRARSAAATNPQVPKLQNLIGGSADEGRGKPENLELKYGHKVTGFLEGLAHKEEERLKKLELEIEASKAKALTALQVQRDGAIKGARDWERDLEEKGTKVAERELESARAGAVSWEKELEEKGAQVAEQEVGHARSSFLQRGMNLSKDLDAAKSSVLQRGTSLSHEIESAKSTALQQGRDSEKETAAKAARIVEAQRDIEMEAERTREAARRASDNVQRVGDSVQRAGESMQRIGKAVEDEIQPHSKD